LEFQLIAVLEFKLTLCAAKGIDFEAMDVALSASSASRRLPWV
jgi:hypothetical protein